MSVVNLTERDSVLTIELNRPRKLNALNLQLKAELADALQEAGSNTRVRAVILTGAGRAFCAGADLSDLHAERGVDYRERLRWLHRSLIQAIANSPKPFIAAVNGPAVGGGFGLAIVCDLVVAATDAFFEAPVARTVGIAPDFGLTHALPASVGLHRARSILLFGRRLPADVALAWGLVDRIAPRDQVVHEAAELANQIAASSPEAIAGTKRLLAVGVSSDLAHLLDVEADEQTLLRSTDAHDEAVKAFLGRQKSRKITR